MWKSRFVEWVCLPSDGRSGGIIVMWDPRLVVVRSNLIGEFSVSIEMELKDNIMWWFSAIYGPVKPREREKFWDELGGLSSICGERWCLGGDFNVVRNTREKMNSNSNTTSMLCFDKLIGELGLYDPPLLNAKYTWSNLRDDPICCRLDRFLISNGWMDFFPHFRQMVLPRITSDHYPVILDTTKSKWGPTPFRFKNVWLSHQNFRDLVRVWWNDGMNQGWEGYKFMKKLKKLKGDISSWNREVFGNVGVRYADLSYRINYLDELEAEGRWSERLNSERRDAKCELENLSFKRFQLESQKAKVRWLTERDHNSKFFHSLLTNRRSKSIIDKVELEDGSLVTKEEQTEEDIVKYFTNLYRKYEGEGGGGVLMGWNGALWIRVQQRRWKFLSLKTRSKKQCLIVKGPKLQVRIGSQWHFSKRIGIRLRRT
ncbi:uncharacterized protein [Primulina huaijiensis]|uniref:uncharacterized protein n=1 Tax=Primulina huaijiensis TaxID=1492673 RepID=UPI003CC73F91